MSKHASVWETMLTTIDVGVNIGSCCTCLRKKHLDKNISSVFLQHVLILKTCFCRSLTKHLKYRSLVQMYARMQLTKGKAYSDYQDDNCAEGEVQNTPKSP